MTDYHPERLRRRSRAGQLARLQAGGTDPQGGIPTTTAADIDRLLAQVPSDEDLAALIDRVCPSDEDLAALIDRVCPSDEDLAAQGVKRES